MALGCGYKKSVSLCLDQPSLDGLSENFEAWRDFYTHIISAFPRVSMGRPYLERFSGVQWETNEEHLQAWKDGRTGYPIVDAAMRQANTQGKCVLPAWWLVSRKEHAGWMHNRCRMIVAMFLTKDLMLDWRSGEKVKPPQLSSKSHAV
jgi:deoxyribodipyrimidine photo-lyase